MVEVRTDRLQTSSEFNVVDYLVQVSDVLTNTGRTFIGIGTQEQLLPDALPAAINDSYGYQRELNPGSLGASQSH